MATDDQEPRLRVKIADLGRVAEADVELAPLTLFVGENNSGKSYVATLLWAVYQANPSLFRDLEGDGWAAAHAAVSRAYRAAVSNFETSGPFQPEDFPDAVVPVEGDWLLWLRALNDGWIDRLLKSAFRAEMKVGSVEIAWYPPSPAMMAVTQRQNGFGLATIFDSYATYFGVLNLAEPDPVSLSKLTAHIFHGAAGLPYHVERPSTSYTPTVGALFLPASRTAYVQVLPDLIDRLIGQATAAVSEQESTLPSVTAPVVQFLRFLVRPGQGGTEPAPAEDLADLLEAGVLRGRVVRVGAVGGQFDYVPTGSSVSLPMGRASAVVSELLPLVMLLREARHLPRLLVYEEPEAHLHPRLQRVVAQVLVRLVRRGVKVLVTTHSDTFAQQINNHIKLGSVPEEKLDAVIAALNADAGDEVVYSREDALPQGDVAAYEFAFRASDDRTVVERLDVGASGVVMPSFNRELMRILHEVDVLNDHLDEM